MIAWVKKMLRRYRRLIKFGVCGVINTGVHWALFALFYHVAGLPAYVSHGLGFIGGSVCGYLLNSRFTFREGRGRTRAQFAQYVGIDAVLFAASSGLMKALEDGGVIGEAVWNGWSVWAAEVGMTAVFALIHYVLYKYLVFRIKKEDG